MTILETLQTWDQAVGLSEAEIARFHESFVAYVRSQNPVFYVRGPNKDRRTVKETQAGLRIAATDNSPAWWAYWAAKAGVGLEFDQVPVHMFDVDRRNGVDAINKARYYVAHILPARSGIKERDHWTLEYAVSRCLCNLHPINHFYVPLEERRIAEDRMVISVAASLAERKHGQLWHEFLALAGPESCAYMGRLPAPSIDAALPLVVDPGPRQLLAVPKLTSLGTSRIAEYSRSRLTFLASVIEPLGWEERFRVRTPFGVYEFTKQNFYDHFPNIPKTRSYQVEGIYHGAALHFRAEAFRVDTRTS